MLLRSILKVKSKRRHSPLLRVNLTSLMDVFCILIFFMLKSFSSEVSSITISEKLSLPLSSSRVAASPALKMIISKDEVMLEDQVIMPVREIMNTEKLLLKPLFNILELYKKKVFLIKETNKQISFNGEIILQIDKDMDFSLLKKIMFTSGQSGFGNIRMMVINSEQII